LFLELTNGNSVVIWVVAVLASVFLIAFFLTARAWRESRLSPYYFQRRQALQQMQSYSLVTLTLMMITAAVVAYAYSPTMTSAPRTAILTNAKPVSADVVRTIATEPEVVTSIASVRQTPLVRATAQSLPTEFATLKPTSELLSDTEISSIIFSTNVNENYEPVGVRSSFDEGNFTLYATFDYAAMQDGMTWSWIWRHDGEVVGGGEQHWSYGEDGPGWVYFAPEEGFAAGEYSLEVWVNGKLQSASTVEVASSIANQ
jgi:hypothetical protein